MEPLPTTLRQWRRRWARWRLSRRALERCPGARAGLWLARSATLGFAIASFYAARPLGGAVDAILHMACATLSWCALLAALSATGGMHPRELGELQGILLARGIPPEKVGVERSLGLTLWTWQHLVGLALLVAAACAWAPEPWRFSQLAGLGAGVIIYFGALGAGLGTLAHVCSTLTRARGQSLLLGLVFIPQLLAPAWPELPTLPRVYGSLLDACLALGARL